MRTHRTPGRSVLAALALAGARGATGCSGPEDAASPAPAGRSDAATPSASSASPSASVAASGAKAPIADPNGHTCAGGLPRDRDVLMVRVLQRAATRPVRLSGLDLAGGNAVTLVDAWAAPGARRRGGGVVTLDYFANHRSAAYWSTRQRLEGARFGAGQRIALLLRLRPAAAGTGQRAAGFDDLTLHYRSAGEAFDTPVGSGARFGGRCGH